LLHSLVVTKSRGKWFHHKFSPLVCNLISGYLRIYPRARPLVALDMLRRLAGGVVCPSP